MWIASTAARVENCVRFGSGGVFFSCKRSANSVHTSYGRAQGHWRVVTVGCESLPDSPVSLRLSLVTATE